MVLVHSTTLNADAGLQVSNERHASSNAADPITDTPTPSWRESERWVVCDVKHVPCLASSLLLPYLRII